MATHPNRRNIIYIMISASLLGGLFTGERVLFNVAYLLGGLLFISLVWAVFAVRWVRISRRTHAQAAQVGKFIEEAFVVRNTAFLPKLWLEVRDHSTLPNHHASHVVPALPARGRYSWTVKTLCVSRGEFRLGGLTIVSGDPFGFFVSPRVIKGEKRIVVYPQVVPIKRFVLPAGYASGGETQRKRSPTITTNASGVRDYVPGDSINRIHWRSTARKEKLIVKEFEIDPIVDLWLFADFSAQTLVEDPSIHRINGVGPIIPRTPGIPPSTEEYVAVCSASIASHFLNTDRSVGFLAYVPTRRILQPDRSRRQLNDILEALSVARSLSEQTLDRLLQMETQYFTRGTTLIIVTASVDPSWVPRAVRLQRRGIRPSVVLVDAGSFNSLLTAEPVRAALRSAGIPFVVVRRGDEIGSVLAQKPQ